MGKTLARHKTIPGDPPIALILRRSGRACRITLRVSSLDGRVTLTLPARASEREALDFAASRADWIRAQQARRPAESRVDVGAFLPVFGVPCRVVRGLRGPVFAPGEIAVRAGRPAGPQVAATLRGEARVRLSEAVGRHAASLGRAPGRITLRDTRSRWGSCSSAGDLMFSWRLILAPPDVLDYVAAHEVAHLARMDHSPAFWAEVSRLVPAYEPPRRWLRAHGASLHAWRFDD